MNIYRKISNITEKSELDEIIVDLKDNMVITQSFRNLFDTIEVKILSKKIVL